MYSDLNVVEVAHDNQKQVMKYITEELHLINSSHGNCKHSETKLAFQVVAKK